MLVSEIFESIQGEGKYTGYPALFIRLSGCTRKCKICDSKYHIKGEEMTVKEIVKTINRSKLNIVVWTGGEPLLQLQEVYKVVSMTKDKQHHLETNGDLIKRYDDVMCFEYVCVSPKDLNCCETKRYLIDLIMKYKRGQIDIKVVTDLELNKELIPYATILMPLTTFDERRDKDIQQKVWNYCVKNNLRFSFRQHIAVWGTRRGV